MSDVQLVITIEEAAAILTMLGPCNRDGFDGANHSVYEVVCDSLVGEDKWRPSKNGALKLPEKAPGESS